jgi:hypothetical protein
MHGAKKKKHDTSEMPYVENYPALKAWLDKHDARCMWQVPMQCEHDRNPDQAPTAYVEQWLFPKTRRLAIILVHAHKHGWDIYAAKNDNDVAATLADAEARLGLS